MEFGRAGFDELLVQMRITNALIATQLQKTHGLTQAQLTVLLSSAGTPSSEIAAVLGTTVNTVQVTLSRIRKQPRRRRTANPMNEQPEAIQILKRIERLLGLCAKRTSSDATIDAT